MPGPMPQQNYTMRGSLPSFGSLGGGMMPLQAQNIPQMFPQFIQPQQMPQFGAHPPDWRNNWATEPNGFGSPLPAGLPFGVPAAGFTPPGTPATPATPPAPGNVNDPNSQAYWDQFLATMGGNASGGGGM